MKNHQDAAVGKRIKLLGVMKNIDSKWMPEEDIPVGTEGTITNISIHGDKRFDQISVQWDNGRTLGLFPYQDEYEVL